ncbi:MAG TPA: hypothetical protein VF614_17555 [Chthoniobacteraceae bacterium]|jgi:hypothetical protein
MNAQDTSPAPLLGARAAQFLGGALLLALAIITYFAAGDRLHRSSLESFERVTAAGDTTYVVVPKTPGTPPLPVATLGGKRLYAASQEVVEARDSRMQLVERDASSGLGVYAATEPVETKQGNRPRTGEKLYFLKVKTNEYLMVSADPEGR